MESARRARLFEIADLILVIGRHVEAAKSVEEQGATPLHAAVLRQIDRRPGVTASEVAEASRMLPSNVSRALRGLEEAGYITRAPDPADARRIRLYPTQKAAENLTRLQDAWSRLLDTAPLTDPQLSDLAAALLLIEQHLSDSD